MGRRRRRVQRLDPSGQQRLGFDEAVIAQGCEGEAEPLGEAWFLPDDGRGLRVQGQPLGEYLIERGLKWVVELRALVVTTADLLGRDPALKDVQVHVDGGAQFIEADAGLLTIVFENLLVNGAQAMQGQGTIRVTLTSLDDTCQISFSDSGPGIPSEVREKIFTPFFTTKARGSGLGLPTAKRLIEAHRGHITIACPSGGGTTVTIHLPAPAPAGV